MTEEQQNKPGKKKKSLASLRSASRLWPFIRSYTWSLQLLIAASILLAGAEAGRAFLIDPLLNRVFLVKSNTSDELRANTKYGIGLGVKPEVFRDTVHKTLAEKAPAFKDVINDQYYGMGAPFGANFRNGTEEQKFLGKVLRKTRQTIEELTDELREIENPDPRAQAAMVDAVVLQRKARELATKAQTDNDRMLAARVSYEARRKTQYLVITSAWTTLRWIVLLAIVFALCMSFGQFTSQFIARTLAARIVIDVQNALARHLLTQNLSFFEGHKKGELYSRLTNDVSAMQIALDVLFSALIIQPLKLVGLLLVAIWFAPVLSLSIVFLGATVVLPVKQLGKKIRRGARRRQRSAAEAVEALQQMLSGIRTVKAFDREDYEGERFHTRTHTVLNDSIRVIRDRLFSRTIINVVNNVTIPLVMLGGGLLVLNNVAGLDAGKFAGFIGAVVMMYMPARQLARAWTQLQDALSGIERVFELFDREPEIQDVDEPVELEDIKEAIEFKDVQFSYNKDKQVLFDINFTAKVGTQTAVVGGTGHGKSTLVDLIPRFITPTDGKVLIDGVDLRNIKRASLLDKIAIVTQDAFLFNDSISNNIRYGRLDATQEEVEEAAKKAQIHDEITAMTNGYETVVGDRGALLSGGQIQRVTIARALLRNPRLLILDEATSGLDTTTEQAVQKAIDELKSGRTSFVIAHRLSTIRNADQILVLQQGRIIECGTYEELVEKDGRFNELVQAQSLQHA